MSTQTATPIYNKKRGQTLIEVMLALTLITMVFASAMTLVINVFNITLNSRNVTIATNIAQTGLATAVTRLQGACNLVSYPMEEPMDLAGLGITNLPAGFELSVTPTALRDEEKDPSHKLDDQNFVKLTATVQWSSKGFPNKQVYKISEVIEK